MTHNATQFTVFGAASLKAGGDALAKGHLANMFGLMASIDWLADDYIASNESSQAGQIRAAIKATYSDATSRSAIATASGHCKFAVSHTKEAFEFFAGLIARKDTYADEKSLINAAFQLVKASGVTGQASLGRLLKGKELHPMKEEKTPESVEDKVARESAELESARGHQPVSLTDLFDESVKTVTVETAPTPLPDMSAPIETLEQRFERWIDESQDLGALRDMVERMTARTMAIHAELDSESEKQSANG